MICSKAGEKSTADQLQCLDIIRYILANPRNIMTETPISLFDYQLPEDLIAATPTEQREESRLLCIERNTGKTTHRKCFTAIEDYLRKGDILVLNDARVLPVRLEGFRKTGGRVEILLIRPSSAGTPGRDEPMPPPESAPRWIAILRSSGSIRRGETLILKPEKKEIIAEKNLGEGYMIIKFDKPSSVKEALKSGQMPLPPYIRKTRRRAGLPEDMPELDRHRYQTVYADTPGAVAAPTAGLHFTEKLLERLRDKGVKTIFLTLLVGPGTFKPVRTKKIEKHSIEPEFYHITWQTAAEIKNALDEDRRIIATGTTCVRVLEHLARSDNWSEHSGWTDIYIYPPFRFMATDALITNFHLPRSTLLMLVSAFAGRQNVLNAYREAVEHRYRFYSYGDATFLY